MRLDGTRRVWRRGWDSNPCELLTAQRVSNPPQWTELCDLSHYAQRISFFTSRLYHKAVNTHIPFRFATLNPMRILDLLFPKRCVGCDKFGAYICSSCFVSISFLDTGICVICQRPAIDGLTHPGCKTSFAIDGVFASLAYKGITKKLLHAFKYPPYLRDLQLDLLALFYEGLIQKEQCYQQIQKGGILVPIPLHAGKLRIRGYNQSALLAAGLAKRFNLPVWNGLQRIRPTETQTKLSKQDRQINIKGAFAIRKADTARVKKFTQVFLVDDILTSGATLAEAARILKKFGTKRVFGLTLAHGE